MQAPETTIPRRPVTDDMLPTGIQHSDPHWISSLLGIWNLIIRPPRQRYSRLQLLQEFPYDVFRYGGIKAQRHHFKINNERGIPLACTLFEKRPVDAQERACVVYCHGNGSCRIAGWRLAPILLPLGISVCCFDFAGSGMSGGDYVSLGFFERDDLKSVIDHLRISRGYLRIGLWGHSMGASTVLMHAARDPSIAGVVADSPFCDLWQLIEEICFDFVGTPPLLINPILHLIRLIIQSKAGFDICDVSPQTHVGTSFVPALFLHGDNDDFVAPSHSETLRQVYPGEAQRLVMPDVSHSEHRSDKFLARAAVFLVRALRWENSLPNDGGKAAFQTLTEGSLPGRPPCKTESPALKRELAIELTRCLQANDEKTIASGIVRLALTLCAPYNGSSSLRCEFAPESCVACSLSPGVQRASEYRTWSKPTRIRGTIQFSDPQAEVGFCWVDSGNICRDGGDVEIAVLSTTSASLNTVRLEPSSNKLVHHPGGLDISSVRPRDFGSFSLEIGQKYNYELLVHAVGTAEILIEGKSIAKSFILPLGERNISPIGDVHLWVVEWTSSSNAKESTEAGAVLTMACSSLENGPLSETSTNAISANKDQIAETFATLCFGRDKLTEVDRAALRSGVYMPPRHVTTTISI